MKILYRISQAAVILVFLGWVAVVYTAVFMPGGHPPLSGLVAIGVIASSWVLNTIGTICNAISIKSGDRSFGQILFLTLNIGLLVFATLVLVM